jgi:thiol-disulfide isomerase/thioredoxin
MAKWWMRWLIVLLLACGGAGVLLGQTTAPSQTEPSQTKPPQTKPPQMKPPGLLPQAQPVTSTDSNGTDSNATDSSAAPVARPGEIYQQALKPLDLVRSSLDNWSDAELGALASGIRMAREACGQISIKMAGEEDLYDLIRLCALGQNWTKSNTAAVTYIASGAEPHRAQAYAMSLNALTHMNDAEEAVKTAQEMLRTLPYDAEVAYALRYFETYLTYSSDPAALALETQEHTAIVEALQTGLPFKAVHGDTVMGAGELFDSGLRLAFLQRYSGDERGAERTYADLDRALTKVGAIGATDTQLISAAETQYKLLGVLLPKIDAPRVLTAPMTKTKAGFDPGHVTVFAIFPDWCPQCAKAMQGLSEFAAEHVAAKVHAVGLMVQDTKPEADTKPDAGTRPDYKALKGTETVAVTKEAAAVFGAVDYPLIVVTNTDGIVYFVGLIPDNAFVPNGYMEQVIGRIVGETAVVRNAPAGKTKPAVKRP